MPFCENCGCEIGPGTGKKFCGKCGAPIEPPDSPVPDTPARPEAAQPAQTPPTLPPPAPAIPPAAAPPGPPPAALQVPPAPGARPPLPRYVVPAILAALVVLAAAAWFFGMPLLERGQGAGSSVTVETAVTAPAVVTPDPVPVTVSATPTAPRIIEGRFGESYEEFYSDNRTYRFGEKVTLPIALDRPPLYIRFNVTPARVNDTKIADIGLSSEHVVYLDYPDPKAWFEVSVIDATSGSTVKTGGFGAGKGYSVQNRQEFTVLKGGEYQIVMAGNLVDAEMLIGIGRS